jgi:hypothetical protein
LDADLKELVDLDEQQITAPDNVLEAGVLEFHGRWVSGLVRSLSEHSAALDVISPRDIPDRFTLALPLEGTFRHCHLILAERSGDRSGFQVRLG